MARRTLLLYGLPDTSVSYSLSVECDMPTCHVRIALVICQLMAQFRFLMFGVWCDTRIIYKIEVNKE